MKDHIQDEIKSEIEHYIKRSNHPHLVDCLDMISDDHKTAIYNMICDEQHKRVFTSVIAFHVAEDIAAIIDGRPEAIVFSKEFLRVTEG